MSEAMPEFKLLQPTSVEAALAILANNQFARLNAGGTDLIVSMRRGLIDADTLVDVGGLEELKRFSCDKSGTFVGAGVVLSQLAQNASIAEQYPAVTQACLTIAGPSHRQAATVGGALKNTWSTCNSYHFG